MSLPELFVPAVLGGLDWPIVIGWVIVAALAMTIGFVVYLALGPGTRPHQAENAEPTPTDDSAGRDADAEERSGAETPTEPGSH